MQSTSLYTDIEIIYKYFDRYGNGFFILEVVLLCGVTGLYTFTADKSKS